MPRGIFRFPLGYGQLSGYSPAPRVLFCLTEAGPAVPCQMREDSAGGAVSLRKRARNPRRVVEASAEAVEDEVWRITVRIINSTELPAGSENVREAALARSLISTHTVLGSCWMARLSLFWTRRRSCGRRSPHAGTKARGRCWWARPARRDTILVVPHHPLRLSAGRAGESQHHLTAPRSTKFSRRCAWQ